MKRMKQNIWMTFGFCALGVALASGLSGCMCGPAPRSGSNRAAGAKQAVAVLNPTQGNQARGTVTFTQVADGVRVVADVQGLSPGKHGFHIHEKGDCSAPDGSSAGGHFNPTGMPHGAPNSVQRHAGDFGNIVADESGRARADFIDTHISFGGPTSILGRGVIVHAQADDLVSQPSGDAGARVACGVIQATPR